MLPFEFENEKFDCALHLEHSLRPGDSARLRITFLCPDLIVPRLSIGSRFGLWELRTIGRGIVEEIVDQQV